MLEVSDLACARGEHQLFANLSFALSAGECCRCKGRMAAARLLCYAPCAVSFSRSRRDTLQGQNIRELDEEYRADLIYLGHLNAIKDELNALENLRISCALSGSAVSDSAAISALRRMGLRGVKLFL